MRCPQCEFDNRPEVRFCEQCGTKLEQTCPACGASVPPDRKFCGAFGQLRRPRSIHRDPFDRLLVAQLLAEPMMLLTNDAVLVGYGPLVQLV